MPFLVGLFGAIMVLSATDTNSSKSIPPNLVVPTFYGGLALIIVAIVLGIFVKDDDD